MSTLDEPLPELAEVTSSLAGLADALGRQRERAHSLLAEQRQRFSQLEEQLLSELTHEQEKVQSDLAELAQRRLESLDRETKLKTEADRLAELTRELETQRQALSAERKELAEQQQLLARDLDQWRLCQSQAESDREAHRAEIARREQETSAREKELEELELETKNQRRKIARDLRTQRAQQMEELEQLRAEIETGRAKADVAEDEVKQQLAVAQEELARLKREQAGDVQASETLHDTEQELDDVRATLKSVRAEAAAKATEALSLKREMAELKEQLASAPTATDAGASEELSDLRKRLEMAVEDLREMKTLNGDLRDQLASAKRTAAKSGAASAGAAATGEAFTWEAQKQKLLAQLESETEPSDPKQKADRLTVEGTIQITDDIVSQKEMEIRELQRLLDEQSQNVGSMAVGAAAIAGILDTDSLIQEERGNLKRMQEEWREKLRQGEVEVALERAKLARQRMEMEEKLSQIESERKKMAEIAKAGKKPGEQQSITGSWLAKLGLITPEE